MIVYAAKLRGDEIGIKDYKIIIRRMEAPIFEQDE